MGGMIGRRVAAASLAVALAVGAAAMPPPAAAVVIVYTVIVLPLTAVADQVTDFTVTVTNVVGPDDLGCIELTVPNTYELHAVSDPVQSAGRDWTAVADGGTVIAWSESGGGRLNILESVTFVVTARPEGGGDRRLDAPCPSVPGLRWRGGDRYPGAGDGAAAAPDAHTGADAEAHPTPDSTADPASDASTDCGADPGRRRRGTPAGDPVVDGN